MEENKEKENEETIKFIYTSLINIYQHDGKEAWNTFCAFLLAQSIIFAFASKSLIDFNINQNDSSIVKVVILGSSILGLLTSILLYLIHGRFSKYNEFRIGQIKEIELDSWNIMKGKGEKFSKGETVELKINNGEKPKEFKIPCLYQKRAKFLVPLIMKLFILAYIILIILFLCRIICFC